MKKIVVIGNGKMAIECLKIMKKYGEVYLPLIIADPKDIALMFLKQYCNKEDLNLSLCVDINSNDVEKALETIKPDLIFNINSFKILKKNIIAVPSGGIINFHNGPLPKYRGINVCSWAILNGEENYGVTWHFIEETIDSGGIVAQSFFSLSKTETACSLILKCIDEGIVLFEDLLRRILKEQVKMVRQDTRIASHYTKKDIPHGGIVDYEWNFEKFDRFVRGLRFHPIRNHFVYPTSYVNSKVFYIQKIARSKNEFQQENKCGQVVSINDMGIDVRINDSVIIIEEILNERFKPIKINDFVADYMVEVGCQL